MSGPLVFERRGTAPASRGQRGLAGSRFLLLALLALALTAAAPACLAQGLDSLKSTMDEGNLLVGFALPVRSLRAAGIEKALDEQGLSVECEVSIEVRKKEGLLNRTVVKALVRRALSYSRWYEEYVLSENAREVATSKSYYVTLERFRRFARMKVADMGTLDPGQEYTVRIEVSLAPRVPAKRARGESPNLASLGVAKDMLDLSKGKGSLLSIKMESAAFRPTEVPRWSIGAMAGELQAARQP